MALLACLGLLSGAGRCGDPPPVKTVIPPARTVPAAPGAYLHSDPAHPYNRAYRALMRHSVHASIHACVADGGCGALSPAAAMGGPFNSQDIELGHDEPLPLLGDDIGYLVDAARQVELVRAVEDATRVSPDENVMAAVLLQADAWDRHDAVMFAMREGVSDERRAALAPLLPPLRRLVKALSLPAETLRAIPPNAQDIARAWSSELPDFGGPAWREVRTRYNEHRDAPWQAATRHAERNGHRMVFRVLVNVPAEQGGPAWMDQHLGEGLRTRFPIGTRFVLVGSPLAVARDGALVPVPVVALVEQRVAHASPMTVARLDDLPFTVLEGTRALMASWPRPGGGLHLLPPHAHVPMGATCMPDVTTRMPLKAACLPCHGTAGDQLRGPMAHGETSLFVEQDPHAAAAEIVRIKSVDPGFRALVANWR